MTVAALYIDRRGPYPSILDVDCWDVTRDARRYEGPHPVIAHPPCGPWGMLRHLYEGIEHDCALRAVEQVRTFGGVLEHPRGSRLWKQAGLPSKTDGTDRHDGYTVEVCQCDWGHVARKRTWLYLVGIPREAMVFPTPREPTHWASGSRNAPRGPVPPGIKVCSAEQRRRTPAAFARWLVDLAQLANVRKR